jgi:hypothetical protein
MEIAAEAAGVIVPTSIRDLSDLLLAIDERPYRRAQEDDPAPFGERQASMERDQPAQVRGTQTDIIRHLLLAQVETRAS